LFIAVGLMFSRSWAYHQPEYTGECSAVQGPSVWNLSTDYQLDPALKLAVYGRQLNTFLFAHYIKRYYYGNISSEL